MRLAPLGTPGSRTVHAVPAAETQVVPPLVRRHWVPDLAAGSGSSSYEPGELLGEVYDRTAAAAQSVPWTLGKTAKKPEQRRLNEAQMTAEVNALHPTTAMLLRQMGMDYGSCPWEIVELDDGRMVDEQAKPVTEKWASRALSMLHNDVDDESAVKERLWWLWHVHGEAHVAVTENLLPQSELPLGTWVFSIDLLDPRTDGTAQGFGNQMYLRAPYGMESDQWFPIHYYVDDVGRVRFPVHRVVNSYGKTPGQPFTVLQSLAPFYQLFWTLVRGDLATADSRAIMNGILWSSSTGASMGGVARNDDAQAIYNFMGLTNSASDPDGLLTMIARQSMNVWKYPGRHLSKLPIPVSGPTKPEFIEIARKFSQVESQKMEQVELRMARGWEAPASLFLGSIGEARQNQFNAWRAEDEYVDAVKRPGRQLDRVMTRGALWPLLEQIGVLDWKRYALRSNLERIRPRRDTPENWMWAARNLGVKREAVMVGLGLPADELLQGKAYDEWVRTLGPTAQRKNNTTTGTGTPDSHASDSQAAGNDATSTDAPGAATPSAEHDLLVALPSSIDSDRVAAASRYSVADIESRVQRWVVAAASGLESSVHLTWQRTVDAAMANPDRTRSDPDAVTRRVLGNASRDTARAIQSGFTRAGRVVGRRDTDLRSLLESRLGLVGSDLWESPADVIAAGVASTAMAAVIKADFVRANMPEPSYSLVRSALAQAYRHDVDSSVVVDSILDVMGMVQGGWQWVYGDAIRAGFPGHEALDGTDFVSWTDDALAVQPVDAWLNRDHYAPGDHVGCGCHAIPVLGE